MNSTLAVGGALVYILLWLVGAVIALLLTVAPLFIWKYTRKIFDEVSEIQIILRGMDKREKMLNEAVAELRYMVKNVEVYNQNRDAQTAQYLNAMCEALAGIGATIAQNRAAPSA